MDRKLAEDLVHDAIASIASRAHDVTSRKKTDKVLRALTRSARAMSFAVDEANYLEEVCRIVVDDCDHSMAWIGFSEENAKKTIRPVAHAGFEEGYLETLHLTWADTARGRGPAGTAIRTGRPDGCANVMTDRRFVPWREEAIKRGYSSALAIPLISGDKAFGAISIYSAEPNAFSPDDQILLTGLASDVAEGIAAIRRRVASVDATNVRGATGDPLLYLLDTLKQAHRNKDQFIAMLSHELRNPLGPIRNSLHVIERAPAGGLQAKRALSIVARQVEHLTRLTDDLLDLTRIAQGKIPLRSGVVDLRQLLLHMVEDYASVFAAAGVALDIGPCEPLSVRGDATRIAQVLSNLLQNAAKFTAPGGRTFVDLGHSREPDMAVIRICDTGAGIALDMLAHVFEPFAQAQRTAEESRGGVGLGLAVVKKLVELQGGSVIAHSEGPGKGAEFTLRLPLAGQGPP